LSQILTSVLFISRVRYQGSAAYNLCTVARGSAEAYYEFGIHCWDIAAGMLILTEAGGVITNYKGEMVK